MGGEAPAGHSGARDDWRRRRRMIAAVALSIGAFAMAAFASSAGSVHPVVQGDGGWRLDFDEVDRRPRQEDPRELDDVDPDEVRPTVAGDVASGIANVLLIVAGAAVVAFLLYRAARVVRAVRLAPRATDDWVPVPADAREELTDAAADGLRLARTDGHVSDVIIGCWLALEAAAGRAGIDRSASETAAELTVRVLGNLQVPENDVRRLLALYGAARYSTHALGEAERAAAIAALEAIHRHLTPVPTA